MSQILYADQLQDLEALRDEVDELQEKSKKLEDYIEDLELLVLEAEKRLDSKRLFHIALARIRQANPGRLTP